MAPSDEPATAAIWDFSQASGRRSLLFCAAGAILGLTVAGFGLFTAKGTRTSAVPAEDVAMVNQVPILMSDYVQQVRALYDVPLAKATPAQRAQVLKDMIREELYVQRGIELGMQADTIEVRQALVSSVEAQAAADATMAQPDEAQLKAYYAAHGSDYADEGVIQLTDYVLARTDGNKAQAAAATLRAQGVTPALAARLGLRATGRMNDGEEYYFAARIHIGDRLFATARKLRAGQLSDPIQTADGLHILHVQRNSLPQPRAFTEVRQQVLGDYISNQAKLLTAGNETFLRKRADIVVQKGFE
ncbi:MAG TPA: peptidylprolyl isomerase [Sphingobium sp.]